MRRERVWKKLIKSSLKLFFHPLFIVNFESSKIKKLIIIKVYCYQPLISYHKSKIKYRKANGSLSRKTRSFFKINFSFTYNLFNLC